MEYKYDFSIVIGRFQPFHKAHLELVKQALNLGEKVILVLGSARAAPNVRNPWTPQMREEMIRACFSKQDQPRLVFRSVRDYPYNDNFWIAEVQNSVAEAILDNSQIENAENARIALIGHFKDRTSYYLNLFPQWNFEDFGAAIRIYGKLTRHLCANIFFKARRTKPGKHVSAEVAVYLEDYKKSEIFAELLREFDYIRKYKADTKFVGVPFDPVFVTTDAVVVQSGHVLVVRRKFHPGKGLLALPGGFLIGGMTLEDSALKELKEETSIHVPAQILKSSIKTSHVFDHPDRSQRGRTITNAFLIELQPSLEHGLPQVKGGDDAARAFWLPLSSIGEKEDEFFEDHVHIIRYFLGVFGGFKR